MKITFKLLYTIDGVEHTYEHDNRDHMDRMFEVATSGESVAERVDLVLVVDGKDGRSLQSWKRPPLCSSCGKEEATWIGDGNGPVGKNCGG